MANYSSSDLPKPKMGPAKRSPPKSTPYRTTYTGPVKNRGEDAEGRAKVSREELADFRRKYGADKTLRDLLNADRTGKLPASEKAPLARGSQGASIAPTRRNATQTMAERSASGAREAQAASGARAAAARESASEMKRESRGQGRQAESTSGMGSKITNKPAPGAKSIYSDLDPGKVTGAAATIASLYPASRMAGMAGRGLMSAMERRAASEGVKRTAKEEAKKEPTFKKGGSVKGGGCETRSKKTRFI